MMERLMIILINIFCPPIAVMAITGLSFDCAINTLFFIAGVIPGHIHAFYLTQTYFHRKRKVRKGIYPGGPKPLIYSETVWNGGASRTRMNELWEAKSEKEDMKRSQSQAKRQKTLPTMSSSGGERRCGDEEMGQGVGRQKKMSRLSMRTEGGWRG